MKRQIAGLRAASDAAHMPDGIFLVRVQRIRFQRNAPKPYYIVALIVQPALLQPKSPLEAELVCFSWITGIEHVAQIVFVRKRFVEIQYLKTKISDDQRQEFGHLVENTIGRIESADFLPHSGIRFPQNPCISCPYVGLCLGQQEMAASSLVRRPGAEDFGWSDELNY
jgi:hypothetical protein